MSRQWKSPSLGFSALLIAGLAFLACGGSTDNTSPTGPGGVSDACSVQPGGAPAPIPDPSGPYYHQVVVAQTTDGVRLTDFRQVLDHASVPDGVRRADGSVLVYYVNGAAGSVWVASLNASAATPIGPIALNGISAPAGVVDPDAVLLPDGRIRLAYLSGFGAPSQNTSRAMCLADSTDGVNFTVVGAAVRFAAGDTTTDPSITRLEDGAWLMAMSRGPQAVMARSADGLTFTIYDTLSYGGVPEIGSFPGDRVRLYVCAAGIESYVSADRGRAWVREATVVPPGTLGKRILCDPSWVRDAGLFIFKTAD